LGRQLMESGMENIIAVDDFSKTAKANNFEGRKYKDFIHRDKLGKFLKQHKTDIEAVFHIGARTDTTEFDVEIFKRLNLNYTKDLWKFCAERNVPFIYASSAATYGDGTFGYKDDHNVVDKLKPLNPYGESKNDFDKWALQQTQAPPFWYGLKFFNVYGPDEYHKGRMASVIFHAFNQIGETGRMKLFRSHKPEFADGMQMRDFIYVKDIASIISFLFEHRPESGLYNAGTGKARAFLHLVQAVFAALELKPELTLLTPPKTSAINTSILPKPTCLS
ncbi:MAG TPA: ADP-glyceromanno-heptose 6-epimerase, partial [Bacteroidales bacterium]|nr:ADP-glyceromanno-heptose 6-epimerase [Bacteroidales bacterium]